jgi:hypothetical protein
MTCLMKAVGAREESAADWLCASAAQGALGADRIAFVGDLDGYPLWRYGPP